jgi:flagellar motor switch protein FliG
MAENLSTREMAAAVLLTMEEQNAALVLRHMDERAIGVVSDTMAQMRSIESSSALQAVAKLTADLESSGAIAPGGFAYLRRMLTAAFGEDRAGEMIERIMRAGGGEFDALAHVDPKTLADQVGGERPQLLAVLVGHMNRMAAAVFLASLPDHVATDIIYRYARVDTVQPVATIELRAMLTEMLGGHVASRASVIGGARQAADLLNTLGASVSERILASIRDADPSLADKIRESMFTFDDLMRIGDQALQAVLRGVAPDRLAPAMRAASPAVRERMLASISNRLAVIVRDEIENGPMVTRADAQAAQKAMIDVAIALAAEGKISLGGQEEML